MGSLRDPLLKIGSSQLGSLVQLVLPGRSCYSAGEDDAYCMTGTEVLRDLGVRTLALVPIRPAGGPAGVLAVASDRRKTLRTDTIELLELLAAHATNRLETIAHVTSLRRLANEDALTGLGNRLAFEDTMTNLMNECPRGAVAILDIDGFKHVNDTFGHLEGDRVLRQLATALRDAVRPSDSVFRLGGDEFAVLLPDTEMAQAANIGHRLEMAASVVLVGRAQGISVGVASIDGSLDDTVRVADRRLYEAKRERALRRSSAIIEREDLVHD